MGDLDKDQIAILQKAFDTFAGGQKFITPEMVESILRMMGTPFTRETLQETIAEVDEDGSGQIEFQEFIILASKFIIEEDDEDVARELKEAFRLYDKEGAGYITTAILKQILHEIDDTLSNEDLDNMITEIDEDGSGTVDFAEFMEMMTGWSAPHLICDHSDQVRASLRHSAVLKGLTLQIKYNITFLYTY